MVDFYDKYVARTLKNMVDKGKITKTQTETHNIYILSG